MQFPTNNFLEINIETHRSYLQKQFSKKIISLGTLAPQSVNSQLYHVTINDSHNVFASKIS